MSETALARNGNGAQTIEQVLVTGDLARLTSEQRVSYYTRLCESLSLNPLTRPFEYLTLNQKLVLYARKDATDQLRSHRNVSVSISSSVQVGDLYVVTARATLPNGRTDEEIGAVNTAGLRGELLANAMMKCVTKAKRRVTLSICGLGLLDESEIDSIPDARRFEERAPPTVEAPTLGEKISDHAGDFARAYADVLEEPAPSVDVVKSDEPEQQMGSPLREECRSVMERMRRINPQTKVTLPDDDAHDEHWHRFLDEYAPKVEAAERRAQTATQRGR
jgi:hypothetical protein